MELKIDMMDDREILNIISNELSNSTYGTAGSGDISDLETSLDYYLGNPNGREVEGRSQVTSTDVADTIEWILPQIMKSFTQNNQVVTFDPVNKDDEYQAGLESEYTYEVLMKENNGFVVLHEFVKDALMQRNGIIKVYYDEEEVTKSVAFTGIIQEQLVQVLQAENVELEEMSEYPDPNSGMTLYDIRVSKTEIKKKIMVDSVPPEEFRVNSFHNSIDLKDARFTAHVMLKTASDLIADGIPEDVVKELSEGHEVYNREYRFSAQDEDNVLDMTSEDDSMRLIEIAESYLPIDIDQTGIARLHKVTTGGGNTPTHLLSVEEIDASPWIATTTFLMSHKFYGLSIYDKICEIQDQKTSLLRNMFDNVYLQNNQRTLVVEGQVNMDDLLISRPGGIVRAKTATAVVPLVTPQLGDAAANLMAYLDQVRAGRTGVDAEGAASPTDIGDRVGSQGVDRLMNAKEELVGLIIRVIAETGIKPLCYKIRDLSMKHMDAIKDYKYRGEWQKINPSMWDQRYTCTVRVGTGTGNKQEQVAAIGEILGVHERLAQLPSGILSDPVKVYNTLDDYCKFSGLISANKYFLDPTTDEGKKKAQESAEQQQKEKQKADQSEQMLLQAQMKLSDAEMSKANAQQDSVNARAQSDNMKNELVAYKQQMDAEIKMLEQQLKEAEAIAKTIGEDDQLAFDYDKLDAETTVEFAKLSLESEKIDVDKASEEAEESIDE